MSHALDRYREHHQDADEESLARAVEEAVEISADLVQSLTCRRGKPRETDTYKLDRGGRGVFVLSGGRLVTYLRLSQATLEVAMRIVFSNTPEAARAQTPPSSDSLNSLRNAAVKVLRRYFNTGALRFDGMPDVAQRVEAMRTVVNGLVADGDLNRVVFSPGPGKAKLEVMQTTSTSLTARWLP